LLPAEQLFLVNECLCWARDIGLSRSAFADRFTRLIGEPPMRYLARWRLQLAAHHLRSSDMPFAHIAEQVGYESGAAFNRAFKRSFGVPPAAWRKNASATNVGRTPDS
jgi:AraC-like DNA-binding protein